MSLIFGAGQVVCGVVVARYSLQQGIWTQARHFLLLLICLWFVCSGALELLVSGLAMSRRVGAGLPLATVDLWRQRADTALILISLVLLLGLLVYPVARRRFS